MTNNIRTRPTSQEFRDNFDATFGWKCARCGTTNAPKAEACYDCKKPRREFCLHCGAGIGEHRREGEGTCGECDPESRGYQGGGNG